MSKQLPSLLVVSDRPSVRFWLKDRLEGDFFVIDVQHRTDALRMVQHTDLEFIILDSAFEESDALALCQELRGINLITPILFITGRLKKSFRDQALESGATDFLNDSLNEEELETRIATGRKAARLREKMHDLSSAIGAPKGDISDTCLKNKILLHDQVLRLLAIAKSKQTPVSLLLARIDRFADLRAQKGFTFVEELLLKTNEAIHCMLMGSDLCIPSEDRFIILLFDKTEEQTRTKAEQLRTEIQKQTFSIKGETVSVTLSIAISSLIATESAFNHMIDAASKALTQSHATTNLIISLNERAP